MEYVEGQTLRDVLNREAPLPPAGHWRSSSRCLRPRRAHDAGLVHRDVKPENVLISDRGRIKVADFGLAKAVSSQTSTATQGLLIGTVSYLPPELVVAGQADARSDVYSAGVVLFELLTGRKPHTGDTPIQIAYAHVHRDVPPPSVGPDRRSRFRPTWMLWSPGRRLGTRTSGSLTQSLAGSGTARSHRAPARSGR